LRLDLFVWVVVFEGGVVALLKSEEVFVGREKEIRQFFEFLKDERSSAFVVVGEPGIWKSSFLFKTLLFF